MNKNLEARLRLRVRAIVESVLNEEPLNPMFDPKDVSPSGAMEKPKGFKPYVGGKQVNINGKYDLVFGSHKGVLHDLKNKTSIELDNADALKIANVLIRMLGKV